MLLIGGLLFVFVAYEFVSLQSCKSPIDCYYPPFGMQLIIITGGSILVWRGLISVYNQKKRPSHEP